MPHAYPINRAVSQDAAIAIGIDPVHFGMAGALPFVVFHPRVQSLIIDLRVLSTFPPHLLGY